MKEHWDRVYEKTALKDLGWYEENPEPSLRLVSECKLTKNASILNVGTGASTIVDELLSLGFRNIIATDISQRAMGSLRERLGMERSHKIKWVLDDLTKAQALPMMDPVDLWHDRAVLHFFNEPREQDAYFSLLKKLVKNMGFVIIATFNLKGPSKCSGLPVHRYNQEMLHEKLGEEFQLKKAFDYTFVNPSGDTREYIYTLFRRSAIR